MGYPEGFPLTCELHPHLMELLIDVNLDFEIQHKLNDPSNLLNESIYLVNKLDSELKAIERKGQIIDK